MAKTPPPDPENQDPQPPALRRQQRSDDDPGLPPGHIVLAEAEHSRLQAELRQANKRLAQIEEQRLAREREEKIESERAAGRFDAALAEERIAREKAEQRAVRAEKAQQLRDLISDRGLTGERAAALRKLVDLDAQDLATEVEATIEAFPNLFGTSEPSPPPADPQRMVRRPGPTTPPATPPTQNKYNRLPADFVTPEEYLDTPMHVRYSDEFRKRVEASKPHWPKKIKASDFVSSNE